MSLKSKMMNMTKYH